MVGRKKVKLDCVVIACHGRYGEDGCLQGMLEMFDLPYVSCGVRASAVGMDKWLFKQVISYMGLPTAPFVGFFHTKETEWRTNAKNWVIRLS